MALYGAIYKNKHTHIPETRQRQPRYLSSSSNGKDSSNVANLASTMKRLELSLNDRPTVTSTTKTSSGIVKGSLFSKHQTPAHHQQHQQQHPQPHEDTFSTSALGPWPSYTSGNQHTASNSVSQAIDVPQHHHHQPQRPTVINRPLRRIRFLPKILSTDSREIDSPEEEEATRTKAAHYALPPKFIDKQFSIDFEDNGSARGTPRLVGSFEEDRIRPRRMGSVGGSGSFDRDDRRGPGRSFDTDDGVGPRNGSLGSLSPKRRLRMQSRLAERANARRQLLRQRNASEESTASSLDTRFNYMDLSVDAENDYLVHCSGEDYDEYGPTRPRYWEIPCGLMRSLSWDSLRGSTELNSSVGSPSRTSRQDSRELYDCRYDRFTMN